MEYGLLIYKSYFPFHVLFLNYNNTGKFIRGCLHNTDCATTDKSSISVENDFYCGAGIGGDTPGCANPTDSVVNTLTDCTTYTGSIAPDGKSGTTNAKSPGLTTSNTGVYRKENTHISKRSVESWFL